MRSKVLKPEIETCNHRFSQKPDRFSFCFLPNLYAGILTSQINLKNLYLRLETQREV